MYTSISAGSLAFSNVSFSTFFSFRLSKPGGSYDTTSEDGLQGADGVVFLLQTLTNNVGSSGGGLGYSGISNSSYGAGRTQDSS